MSPVGKDKGFSLLELLVVLLILGISGLIVLPSVEQALREREIRQSALGLAASARDLRSRAIREGALYRLVLRPSERSYQVWQGQRVRLSSEVRIAEIVGGEPIEEGGRQFVFFPNGSVLGGGVRVSGRDGSPAYWVRFEPLTGRVGVARGEVR